MRKCERCGSIVWPWQDYIHYVFGDYDKHLCIKCAFIVSNTGFDILLAQREYFLKVILASDWCHKGIEPLECDKMDDDSHTKEEICFECWCNAARKATENK